MKKILALFLAAAATTMVRAAPADDVAVAAKALGASLNYSWTSTDVVRMSGNGTPRVEAGQTERGGFTVTQVVTGGKAKDESVRRGTQLAFFRDGKWQTEEELLARMGGTPGTTVVQSSPGGMSSTTIARRNEGTPVDPGIRRHANEILALLGDVKTLTVVQDRIEGTLPFEAVAQRSRMRGADGRGVTLEPESKGTVKFWLKNGAIAKYEVYLKVVRANSNAPALERTTTVEIRDIDTTTVKVPEEAKAKFKS